jgi:hypothetical protein
MTFSFASSSCFYLFQMTLAWDPKQFMFRTTHSVFIWSVSVSVVSGRHLGVNLGTSGRHLGGIWRHLGAVWEASGVTREAPGHSPGHPRLQRRPGAKVYQNHYVFVSQSGGGDHFRVDRSDVTITVYRACSQDCANAWAPKAVIQIPNTEDTPTEPLPTAEDCLGKIQDLGRGTSPKSPKSEHSR